MLRLLCVADSYDLPGQQNIPSTISTNINDKVNLGGRGLFYEVVQRDGYTNRGSLLGDPIGRENTGGNAWLTWHRSAESELQIEYRQVKAASDFIPSGTTQNDLALNLRLRPARDLELRASLQGELWRAPLIRTGTQHNISATLQLTWFPAFTR